jgi:hypothetical protein
MRPILLIVILLLVAPADTYSQVRVRHGIHLPSFKREKDHIRKIDTESEPPARRKIASDTQRSEKSSEVDEYFYIKWDKNRKLTYSDFKCAKAPCKPLVTEKETELLRTIYPNYQAFYNMLEQSREADTLVERHREDSVKHVINGQLDSLYGGFNYSVSVDYNINLSKEMDSPAASALVISPVIYNVNETTFYYNIAALFSKFDSWMIIKSADILQHEQIHFDIFELYARKLRKQWVELLQKSYGEGRTIDLAAELAPIYDRLYKDLYKVQADFDEQTAALTGVGAPLVQLNEEWDRMVKGRLAELKDYEQQEGTVIVSRRK